MPVHADGQLAHNFKPRRFRKRDRIGGKSIAQFALKNDLVDEFTDLFERLFLELFHLADRAAFSHRIKQVHVLIDRLSRLIIILVHALEKCKELQVLFLLVLAFLEVRLH